MLTPKEKERLIRNLEIPDPVMVEILRNQTPAKRLEIAFSLWETAREIIQVSLKSRYPTWTDKQLEVKVARRLLL